nr:hypothetical protein [Tanacetum cinerariifolium]
ETGSPVLERLDLTYCSGFRIFDITSKSVKKFMLHDYMTRGDELEDFAHIIEIKAPYILSVTIKDVLFLSKIVLLNVSFLIVNVIAHESGDLDGDSEEGLLDDGPERSGERCGEYWRETGERDI